MTMVRLIFFTIASVVFVFPATILHAAEDIRDVKAPVLLPSGLFWPAVIILILLLAASVAGYFYLRHRKREVPKEPEVVKAPWEVALQRLAELKADGLLDRGEFEEYYVRLSDIVRRYIEDSFAIRAPEMTTEEFLTHVKGKDVLSARQKETLESFLVLCDMVKFAKHAPGRQEAQESFVLAEGLIERK